jgi:hypothetical protein
MASYNSFKDPITLVDILAPGDEITSIQGRNARNVAEKYVQMSGSFPELIRNLKKAEHSEKDRNLTEAILNVRRRAEYLLGDLVENQ